jgi:uncharacterized protein
MDAPEQLFLVTYRFHPDWQERRTPHREAHLALAAAWNADGRLIQGMTVGEPPHTGMTVLAVDDLAAAQAFADADPYVTEGVVAEHRVEPLALAPYRRRTP